MRFRAESSPRILSDGRWSIAALRVDDNEVSHPFEVYIAKDGVQEIEQKVMAEARELVKPNIQAWIGTAHQILDWRLPDFVERWCKQQPDTSISAAVKGNKQLQVSLQDVKESFSEEQTQGKTAK
jgi:hypothetical protein